MEDLNMTLKRLREERRQIVSQVAALDAAIAALEEAFGSSSERRTKRARRPGRRRRLSAAAREKIASAQRARWARVRQQKSGAKEKKPKAA